ncbi:hypothetical protein DFK10_04130 [Salibaculum griseiflavum]|uniref:Lipoprotein n=2 Tax=Salibaculum griseiflavum TaxID=1914409 RepID=A0A2V1P989_9RHOB|nr:hypothetical protein DFK10_04130 [Salibaculum griseiflavum]
MEKQMKPLFAIAALLAASACSIPDQSSVSGATTIPHTDVDVLPETIRSGEAGFTGVIVYGDRGYTGIVGDIHYPNIRVAGNPIGKCEKRRAMVVPLAPGTYVVSAHSENTVEHEVTLEEGSVAYFRCNFMRIGGILFPPAVLEPVEAERAYEIVNSRN